MIRCASLAWRPIPNVRLKHTWFKDSVLGARLFQVFRKAKRSENNLTSKPSLTMDVTENNTADNSAVTTGSTTEENVSTTEDPVSGYATFDAYLQDAFDAVQSGIKSANNLPSGDNYNYYKVFPSFNSTKEQEIKRLLDLIQHVCGTVGVHTKLTHINIEERFDVLQEANDVLLDRANVCMDEESGITGNLDPNQDKLSKKDVGGSWNVQSYTPASSSSSNKFLQLPIATIQKPQTEFKDKIDNSFKPWCPRIKDKPNAVTPLHIYLIEDDDGGHFNHPYEDELERFTPSESQLKKRTPVKYKSLDETPLVLIEKPGDVKKLLDDLRNQAEIAIDLEHHSHRSFQGFTCLMQIATPDTDYIVDTLSLRESLHELNEVFTNPKILKVLHGASLDVIWLQRDLSLYIVNMFDTYYAASQLSKPFLGLAYLLKTYCNVQANKHLQLADWRVRPLPDHLLKYAREDVHYLLNIKDHLMNELIDLANGQSNILKSVFDMSTEVCKKTYIKPVLTEDSYLHLYRQSKKIFNNKQLYALKELYTWRDKTARESDDSTGYVLPNHMLLSIAETLPREMQGILACCNPIPPPVRQHLLTLHKIVLKAREQTLIKPQLTDDLRQRLAQRNHVPDSEVSSYCPHDIPSGSEPQANLPCLLDDKPGTIQEEVKSNAPIEHKVTVFDSPATSEEEEVPEIDHKHRKKKLFTFISPFERYKRVLYVLNKQETEEREKEKQEEEKRATEKKKDEEETIESINRIHDHFKQVTRSSDSESQNVINKKREKSKDTTLTQMNGGKRKMYTSAIQKKEEVPKVDKNLSTPVPELNKKVTLETKRKAEDDDERPPDVTQPLRKKVKGDKKKTERELAGKGMMPAKRFDYKDVDFSSFQGGSTNAPNQVHFEQNTRKKRKHGKKKRPKVNI